MKTHGEVQAAIDAGEQLQRNILGRWEDISHADALLFGPSNLRIKPEPPERLECWANPEGRITSWSEPPAPGYPLKMREVRPGDMTREEIGAKITEFLKNQMCVPDGPIARDLRRIFLGDGDE